MIPEIASLARAGFNGDGWLAAAGETHAGASDDEAASSDWRRQKLSRNERIRTQELALELDAN